MKDGANPNNVHGAIGRADFEGRAINPVFQLLALFGRTHRLVIFQIVKKHQIGTIRAMTTAANLLGSAEAFDANVVSSDDLALAPKAAFAEDIGEVIGKARVRRQLGLQRFHQKSGLLVNVADFKDVTLEAERDAIEREAERKVGGFRGTAGRNEKVANALFAGEDFRAAPENLLMEKAMLAPHVVRKIGFHEELKTCFRVPDLCQPLGFRFRIGREGRNGKLDPAGQIVRQFGEIVLEVLGADIRLESGALHQP
ncbi:hypothetical protein [Rhizobium ruizarguesonis]